ncbi:entericidin A/B family lipoprotein [Neisseria sp. Ec49-e6-T10]
MKKILILICGFTLLLTGCNTVKGVGQDIQKGGQAIERVGSK